METFPKNIPLIEFKLEIPTTDYRLFDNSVVKVPNIFMNYRLYIDPVKMREKYLGRGKVGMRGGAVR